MKKHLLGILLASLATCAIADDMADAVKAWEKQDFTLARQLFTKLAEAGNADAQLQLGEMYGFGEGGADDLAQATKWLEKAQAGGNKEAAASLSTVKERAARKNEIVQYINSYDGADVKFASFKCVKPEVPAVSKTRAEIKSVGGHVQEWLDCYNRFAKHLGEVSPPGKVVPPALAKLMSTTEFEGLKARMNKIYSEEAAKAKSQAEALIKSNDAWIASSEQYLKLEAEKTKNQLDQDRVTLDQRNDNMRNAAQATATGGLKR